MQVKSHPYVTDTPSRYQRGAEIPSPLHQNPQHPIMHALCELCETMIDRQTEFTLNSTMSDHIHIPHISSLPLPCKSSQSDPQQWEQMFRLIHRTQRGILCCSRFVPTWGAQVRRSFTYLPCLFLWSVLPTSNMLEAGTETDLPYLRVIIRRARVTKSIICCITSHKVLEAVT